LLIDINQKQKALLSEFETTFNNRFPDYNYWKREEMGIGQAERLLGKIQPYLFDDIFYEDLDTVGLDRLFNEIVEVVKIIGLNKEKLVKIMQLISDMYIVEAEGEHDWDESLLIYKKALISSKYGLSFVPNDRKLLWFYGVTCKYLDLYDNGIKTFLRLYRLNQKLDKKKYRELKKKKKQGGKIIEIVEAGPLDYLIILYKEIGLSKRVKWAKEQNRKRKQKFRKLTTGF